MISTRNRLVAPLCGTYELALATTVTGATPVVWELYIGNLALTVPHNRQKVGITRIEFVSLVAPATDQVFGLTIPITVGNTTGGTTPVSLHEEPDAQGAALSKVRVAWTTTAPVVGNPYIRQGIIDAIGVPVKWEWPEDDPLVIGTDNLPADSSICIQQLAGTNITAGQLLVNVRLKEFKSALLDL
jgi:hypothetical protein